MEAHRRSLSTSSSTAALADREIPQSPRYTSPRQRRSWPTILLPCRVGIRLVTTALAIAIAGLLAYTVIIRDSTKDSRFLDAAGNNVMAWPQTIWMQPTIVLFCAVGVSFLFDMISLIMSCAEVQPRGLTATWLGSLSFVASIAAWVVALFYAKTWKKPDSSSSDLWSWSCSHQSVDLNYGNDSFPLGRLCEYMDSVFCAGTVTVALQLVNLVLFWVVKKEERAQKRIAKRNAYARKYILGHEHTASQDQ